jgi:hypothetical protein
VSDLQHERIVEVCTELRLDAVPASMERSRSAL